MQNLTLPIKQSQTVKLTEEGNKNISNQRPLSEDETKNSFQSVLNKQVEAKLNAPKLSDKKSSNPSQSVQKPSIKENKNQGNPNSVQEVNDNKVDLALTNQVNTKSNSPEKPASANMNEAIADEAQSLIDGMQVELTKNKSLIESEAKELKSDKNDKKQVVENSIIADASVLAALMNPMNSVVQTAKYSTPNSDKRDDLAVDVKAAETSIPTIDSTLNQAFAKNNSQTNLNDNAGKSIDTHLTAVDNKLANHLPDNGIGSSDKKLQNLSENSFKTNIDQVQILQRKQDKNDGLMLNMPNSIQSQLLVQQSSMVQANAPLASSNQILPNLGTSAWDQAISQKVMFMVGNGEQSATLTLNPPDLGPLQVVIHVHNDQADTTFMSDNADVRQALQDGMANLRDQMASSGLQLGQANVSAREQSQQAFQQATQNRNNDQRQQNAKNANETTTQAIIRVNNGLVDTFV